MLERLYIPSYVHNKYYPYHIYVIIYLHHRPVIIGIAEYASFRVQYFMQGRVITS
jgi:hypothetical protein